MAVASKAGGVLAAKDEKRIIRTVFIALLLDILAFTMILPLFPEMINFYRAQEVDKGRETVLSHVLWQLNRLKTHISHRAVVSSRFDTVLLGGLVGSLFSFLQFIASPIIGRMSDRRGRRYTLLATMWGNILSTAIWCFASTFSTFLLARVVGGLSEGNVQLSIAIMSDVTSDANRSKALALVGIAFSVGFTVGPAIGAFMARYNITGIKLGGEVFNPFSVAAAMCLALLIIETLYLYIALPETHLIEAAAKTKTTTKEDEGKNLAVHADAAVTRRRLRNASAAHFAHLFLFSGMEFSLTFLTFELFHFSSAQNGRLLGFIGIFASLIQGGYIRRKKSLSPNNDLSLSNQGVTTCLAAFILLALVTPERGQGLLWAGGACLSFTSATVVNCLTAYCSKVCDPKTRGTQMGQFRSWGQLGRSLGPILCCGLYWFLGKTQAYTLMSVAYAVFFLWFNLVVKGYERRLSAATTQQLKQKKTT
ncbi:hypothetical protein PYCC9005_005285 [Savitreella phatthalungensis]